MTWPGGGWREVFADSNSLNADESLGMMGVVGDTSCMKDPVRDPDQDSQCRVDSGQDGGGLQ